MSQKWIGNLEFWNFEILTNFGIQIFGISGSQTSGFFEVYLNHHKSIDCQWSELVGDGYCHDYTNNLQCAFDLDDCCGSFCVNTEECQDCKCKTGIVPGKGSKY